MHSNLKGLIALIGLAVSTVCPIHAQDSGALVEALVKKGVLTDQEGEEIRADLTKEYASTSAGKLNVSSHIKQLRIYGDGRWRYEYNSTDAQNGSSGNSHTWRARYRIRLGIDYSFTDQFSGGFELESSTQNDGAMQTIGSGFGKFSINVGLLYLTYKPWDFATLTGGKIKNPFYTTDMLWDPDVNPEGAAEMFSWKAEDNLTVGLTMGQFNYTENTDSGSGNNANKDSWIFGAQAPVNWKVSKDVTAIVAPSVYVWTPGSTASMTNSGTTPNTGSPAFLSNNGASYLNIIAAPGEVGFKMFGKKSKFYWDLVYNLTGTDRIREAYLVGAPLAYRNANLDLSDSAAWLVGLKIGENKKKGDWAISGDFRQVGLGSTDPNLADSEWGNGYPNQQGVKLTAAYNFTDFFTGGVNYYTTWNYKESLVLPSSAAGSSLTQANATQRFQVEATWKF